MFKNVDDKLSTLTDVLDNSVIKQYSDVSAAVTQMFDNDFASDFKSLLDMK